MKRDQVFKLIVSILIALLAGAIGSFFTMPSIETWYASLNKPAFNPPNWIFGPVWTLLYILMGVSAFLIWDKMCIHRDVTSALVLFAIQLVLNSIWSILFFELHSPLYAFIEIIFLWFAILFTIFKFYTISKTAAYLLIPYICWVTFASVLNFYILILN